MKHIIVGTAGHIDHGKTALVKALTGIDADRLEEEKRRGITIDLGFAHLQLTPALRLGFVDVPATSGSSRTCWRASAASTWCCSSSPRTSPSSRRPASTSISAGCWASARGVIALTKADLVDADILGLVRLEVEEMVKGSFLEGAAIVPVSSVTGAGLDELRGELERAAQAPSRKRAPPAISACPSTASFR